MERSSQCNEIIKKVHNGRFKTQNSFYISYAIEFEKKKYSSNMKFFSSILIRKLCNTNGHTAPLVFTLSVL